MRRHLQQFGGQRENLHIAWNYVCLKTYVYESLSIFGVAPLPPLPPFPSPRAGLNRAA